MIQEINTATANNFKGTSKAKTLEMLQFLGEDIQPLKTYHYTQLRKLITPALTKYNQRLSDELIVQQELSENKKLKQYPKLIPTQEEINNNFVMSSSLIFTKSGELLKFKNFPKDKPVEEVLNGIRSQVENKLNDKVNSYKKLKTNISVRVIYGRYSIDEDTGERKLIETEIKILRTKSTDILK